MKKIVLPQIVAIGIYNAQIGIKKRSITKNRKTTMFELELPIGNGGLSYINDESYPIHENMVICAKPGQIRHTRLPFKCYYIHMIVTDGYLGDILTSLPNYIDFSDTEQIKKIFISLYEHYNTGISNDDILLQSLILKLIYILGESSVSVIKSAPKSNNHKTIERTLEYINNNLSADLTLERLASAANFNAIYFHKLFKASTGKTLHEYVEDQRIKKSISLLISTNMTLAEIAYECGFSSQSYFSYAFKKKNGFTPREYAKKIQLKYENPK
ncbi:MAG: helix-turn-helix transcriptional regulator [Clostridia bacterium]|nr:helix-turn-helix transcriptional regulator [Clostridia bacterium]